MQARSPRLFVKRLDLALQRDQEGAAFAVQGFAGGHLHPAFADAVFLHIKALFAVEHDADVVLEHGGDVVRAARVNAQAVGQGGGLGGGGGIGHGLTLSG